MALYSAFSLFGILIYLVSIVVAIYLIVLFVKLARRGIQALDIYIDKHQGFNNDQDHLQ
ncbi:hypothetical protein ACFSVM_04260 [Paenibacillus shunpengii]|uniref:DUF4083 domain-containing protein n=1 Tax=Paenibacillus shunpengii TaxID=2054424 RepID=A0ABW5SIS7_9BACL|nr:MULTISPECIES: hypothetical protein [unclassified Paenibacillus]